MKAPGKNRCREQKKDLLSEYEHIKPQLVDPPFVVSGTVDHVNNARMLADTGCNVMGAINSRYAQLNKIQRIPILPRTINAYDDKPREKVTLAVKSEINIGGVSSTIWMYEIKKMDYDVILGLPWMERIGAVIDAEARSLTFKHHNITIAAKSPQGNIHPISAATFKLWHNRSKKTPHDQPKPEIFSVSMADIEKALKPKVHSDPRTKLPGEYWKYLPLFNHEEAQKLPPLRGEGIDHTIELVPDENGKLPTVPFGPLYSMSREELMVLRKTLNDLLDKGFIRVSNSPVAAPVLFVKKPGGGLRFCVDYRALNNITRKDRYPLPLTNETLERIGRATWFTKLDVISAFHKIRMAEGSEWMTAFRTRYGLYEWLVTPFGLANAPSAFQKYINWAIREFLDEFASAYLDDVLIFTSGSLAKHRKHVSLVLDRLKRAGLFLDIDKCEFEVQSTKYLGFIIEAGKGVRMDPAKVQAIKEWETPRSVKGVRAFLGFANFYRRFIRNFSRIVAPLTNLTRKDRKFIWTPEAENAFSTLKDMFISAPILMQFDPDRTTVLEVDSSGYVTGGLLTQYDDKGVRRPCAFFSRKNTPAECNYEIYDKELLAIVKCVREWGSELRSVKHFEIITDHKNLTYFTTSRKLKERQMRWAEELSQYNFTIRYRPGKEGTQPDVLSRREQDMPEGADNRYSHREMVLLKPDRTHDFPDINCLYINTVSLANVVPCTISPVTTRSQSNDQRAQTQRHSRSASVRPPDQPPHQPDHQPHDQADHQSRQQPETQRQPAATDSEGPQEQLSLHEMWEEARSSDSILGEVKHAVEEGARRFPPQLKIPVSISECSLDADGDVCFRNRKWVPDSEPLRTRITQEAHDSIMNGHPGREGTYQALARQFYWPGMSSYVRQFCNNCDRCRSSTIWRERKHGLLKPLPIADRKWRQISMDFIQGLPESNSCTNILVITDRLTRGVILSPMANIGVDSTSFA